MCGYTSNAAGKQECADAQSMCPLGGNWVGLAYFRFNKCQHTPHQTTVIYKRAVFYVAVIYIRRMAPPLLLLIFKFVEGGGSF